MLSNRSRKQDLKRQTSLHISCPTTEGRSEWLMLRPSLSSTDLQSQETIMSAPAEWAQVPVMSAQVQTGKFLKISWCVAYRHGTWVRLSTRQQKQHYYRTLACNFSGKRVTVRTRTRTRADNTHKFKLTQRGKHFPITPIKRVQFSHIMFQGLPRCSVSNADVVEPATTKHEPTQPGVPVACPDLHPKSNRGLEAEAQQQPERESVRLCQARHSKEQQPIGASPSRTSTTQHQLQKH